MDPTTFRVTELPPRRSIESFKTALLEMQEEGLIKGFREHHTEREMSFTVHMTAAQAQAVEDKGGPIAFFKLAQTMSTTNMHLFGADGHIRRFGSAEDILSAHVPVRLALYRRRRERLLSNLDHDIGRAQRRRAFLAALVRGDLALMGRPKAAVMNDIHRLGLADGPAATATVRVPSRAHARPADRGC